jgi:hypothetical protein
VIPVTAPTPVDRATRATRQALRPVVRDSVVSVSSRYDYQPTTRDTTILTMVFLRPECADPAQVAELLSPLGEVRPSQGLITLRTAA